MIGRGRNLSQVRDRITFEVKSVSPLRLDRYLIRSLDWKSRTRLQKLIREGYITVNKQAAKPSQKVMQGDVVNIQLSHGAGVPESYEEREFEILYEDRWLVAINKPPGLLVHPVGRHVYDTLINYMHHHYHGAETEYGQHVIPRLCHRLDRDTTGVLVIAKEAHVHRQVQYQFENRLVAKEYYALVAGSFDAVSNRDDSSVTKTAETMTVTIPLGEGNSLQTCLEHSVLKKSRTDFRIVERYRDYTLLTCHPQTGRQNQIRVHLAAVGLPIVGDTRYGPSDGNPTASRYGNPTALQEFARRYLLHSRRLRFFHPRWKSVVEITAPVPPDFGSVLTHLESTAPLGSSTKS